MTQVPLCTEDSKRLSNFLIQAVEVLSPTTGDAVRKCLSRFRVLAAPGVRMFCSHSAQIGGSPGGGGPHTFVRVLAVDPSYRDPRSRRRHS